jgi:hypothetical protein
MRALSRRRAHRYQTMSEMLDALAAAFPDSASAEELGEIVRRLCGDSLSRERARLEKALAGAPQASPARQHVSIFEDQKKTRETGATLQQAEMVAPVPHHPRKSARMKLDPSVHENARQLTPALHSAPAAEPSPDTPLPSSQLRMNTFSPSYVSAQHRVSADAFPRVRGRAGIVIAGAAFVGAFAMTLVVSTPRTTGRPPMAAGAPASAANGTASRPVQPNSTSSSTCGSPECAESRTSSTPIASVMGQSTNPTSQIATRPPVSGADKVLPSPSAAAPKRERAKKPDAVLQRYGI